MSLFFASPYSQDTHVVIKLQPKACVGHAQLRRNKLCRNVAWHSTVYVTIARQDDNAKLPRNETREHLRRNAVEPFLRIPGLCLPAHGALDMATNDEPSHDEERAREARFETAR